MPIQVNNVYAAESVRVLDGVHMRRAMDELQKKGSIEMVALLIALVGGLVLIGTIAGLPGWASFLVVMASIFGVFKLTMRA